MNRLSLLTKTACLVAALAGAGLAADEAANGSVGPTMPRLQGISQASTAPVWVAYGTRALLHHLPGATVTVEDSLPEILPQGLFFIPFRGGPLRMRSGEKASDPHLAQAPEWMSPTVIMSGPNALQRSYAFGGLVF